MRVTVTIYGVDEDQPLVLGAGARVGDAISALGLDKGAAGIVVLGGKIVSDEMPLRDEDALTVYPPLVGG